MAKGGQLFACTGKWYRVLLLVLAAGILSMAALFYLWLMFLEFNLGVYGIVHATPCDVPLSEWMLSTGALSAALDLTLILLIINIALTKNSYTWQAPRRCWTTFLQVLIGLLLLGVFANTIMGNVWYFQASQGTVCKGDTPVPEPVKLMMPLFKGAGIAIFFCDVILLAAPLACWCGWTRFSFLWSAQPLYPWRGVLSDEDGHGSYQPVHQRDQHEA